MKLKVYVLVLMLCGLPALVTAGTNTPYEAGQMVSVTTNALTVRGRLEESASPHWIQVTEEKSQEAIAIRVEVVQTVTETAARSSTPAAGRPILTPESFDPTTKPKFRSRQPQLPAARSLGTAAGWKLRSKHFLHGMPSLIDARHSFAPDGSTVQPGVSVLVREGFVVGHYDKFKVPLWVAQKWSATDLDESQGLGFPRPFRSDDELPLYAQAGTDYEYATSDMQRGHMARHQDNAAYGRDNSAAGCLMSNIAPQHKNLNPESWLALENEHRNVVSGDEFDIDTIWVISGTVFRDGQSVDLIGNDIGVPEACYKVVAWEDANGRLQVRGYLLKQSDHLLTPEKYLVKVDQIEDLTGLDFFSELPDTLESTLESHVPSSMWESEQ